MDVEKFKSQVRPVLEAVIAGNGGIDHVREIHRAMPSFVDFLAGWVAGAMRPFTMNDLTNHNRYSQEELRRLYDLVRLRLDTESSTS
jgi:hypothetical protein